MPMEPERTTPATQMLGILFADVSGSTRLYEQYGDAIARADLTDLRDELGDLLQRLALGALRLGFLVQALQLLAHPLARQPLLRLGQAQLDRPLVPLACLGLVGLRIRPCPSSQPVTS